MPKTKSSKEENPKPRKRIRENDDVDNEELRSASEDFRPNLKSLPDIPVLMIASHLTAKDLINFSYSCKNVFDICENDQKVWSKALEREVPDFCQECRSVAKSIYEGQTLFSTANVAKLSLLIYARTNRNWRQGRSVRVRTLVRHRDSARNPDVRNLSSFLAVSRISYKESGSGSWTLDLTVWDVTSGTTKELTSDPPCSLVNLAYPEVIVTDTVIVCYFPRRDVNVNVMTYQYIGYRLDLASGSLKEVWRNNHAQPAYGENVLEKFYINSKKAKNGSKHPGVLVEGFSLDDGSKLFSQEVVGQNYFDYPSGVCSPDGWFVFSFSNRLFSLNYKKNLFRMFREDIPDHPEMTLKRGKLLCLYEDQFYVELYDLATGALLRNPFIRDWTEEPDRQSFSVDFDPMNNEIRAAYSLHGQCSSQRLALKIFNGQQDETKVIAFDYRSPVTDREMKLMQDSVVRLDCVLAHNIKTFDNISNFKYCLKVAPSSAGGLDRTLVEGECPTWHGQNDDPVTLKKTNPFMIVLQGQSFVTVVDFLKIDEYFK